MKMYARFAGSLIASLVAMYALSFSEIEVFDHFQFSLSNFYITVMMVSVMGLIMLLAMSSMLENTRLNLGLAVAFVGLLVVAFLFGRNQSFVGDDAFLRSMIPHHSRAILVCEEAQIADPDILTLCAGIIDSQRQEILQMEQIMEDRAEAAARR